MNTDARKLFSVLCWIGCVVCAVLATSALSRDEGEVSDYIDVDLPADVFLQYSRIGHDYGMFAATYWRYAVYEGSPQQAKSVLAPALQNSDARAQIEKAVAADFRVAPDAARDSEIMQHYRRIRETAPDLQRRAAFSQRFKDMMAYIGGAAVLGFLGFYLGRPRPARIA